MKKTILSLLMLTSALSISANVTGMKKTDPIRQKITWQAPAAPSNADGEIEKIYLAYNTPDGKEHQLICEMPWPVYADIFVGGDISEEDINFDGIPDLQVLLCYLDASGHNPLYDGFVWDTATHTFLPVEGYSDIVGPTIYAENKCIVGRLISLEETADIDQYEWRNGRLQRTYHRFEYDIYGNKGGETIDTALDYDDDENITKVTLFVNNDSKMVQTLETTEWLEALPNNKEEVGKLSREDINFDGHPDIVVYLGQYSNLGLDFYDAWVWDAAKKRYTRVDKYHEIPCPSVNQEKKWIESESAVSFSQSVYLRYEWKKGKLVLTKKENR
jgi:hypothetical protein